MFNSAEGALIKYTALVMNLTELVIWIQAAGTHLPDSACWNT